jgi:hypothetical protein
VADREAPVEVALTIAARPETIFRYFTDPARFARWMGDGPHSTPPPAAACGSATGPARSPAAGWWPSSRTGGSSSPRTPVGCRRRIHLCCSFGGPSACASGTPDRRSGATRARTRRSRPAPPPSRSSWSRSRTGPRCAFATPGCPPASRRWPTWPAGGTRWPPWPTPAPPKPCHGLVRFGWAAVGPGEVVVATGTNVAGVDLDGRFRWVTGFWDPTPGPPEPL